ncbi:recombinase family protein [Desulfosporosinus sp. SB140]|uniref:recombinase family protein n=1 Tax=Desulfosporosinus paludis TaxID=3115649 RepID=UPI00388CFE0F
MKIGYVRVSTSEQNTARQEVLMPELGVDEVYIDKVSGKNTNRPELQKMLEYVRKGDTVIVESISRFARNTKDLLELIEKTKGGGLPGDGWSGRTEDLWDMEVK